MVKLNRFTMPVFAGNAAQTQTSVFGTMKTSPQYTTDVAASIGTTAYGNGWADAIEIGYAPYMEDMNTLQRAITYQISYNQQQGIPEWDSSTEYYIGSLAKLNTANGSQVYSSLIDNNVGNLVSDATKWKLVLDTSVTYANDTSVVHIAGAETITGAKTFTDNILVRNGIPKFNAECTLATKGTAPSTTLHEDVNFNDKDGNQLTGIVGYYKTNKETQLEMRAYKSNASTDSTYGVLSIVQPASGDPYATAPASDVNNSIVTTVNKSKAANGYFQLGNGLIVQWGRTKVSVLTGASHTPVTTITLPKAFTTTNYSLTGTFESNTSTSASETDDVTFCTTSISTTSVQGFGYDAGGNTYDAYLRWVAIGY